MPPLSTTPSSPAVRAKYTVKSTDWGTGVFPALPSIGAASTADITIVVTKRFKIGEPVVLDRNPGTADPAGVAVEQVDVIAPLTVGANPRIRVRFSNSTAGSLTPTTQQYDFIQL